MADLSFVGISALEWSVALNIVFVYFLVAFGYATVLDNIWGFDGEPLVILLMCVFWPIVLPLHILKSLCRFIGNL